MTTALLVSGSGLQQLVLDGPFLLAALLAVAAGLVSFVSPCCLPLVPGYLSYVAGLTGDDLRRATVPGAGQGRGGVDVVPAVRRQVAPRWRAVWGTTLFVLGFAAVFTSYGALFGSLGALLAGHQDALIRVLGILTIVMGLVFTGILWRVPWLMRTVRPRYRPRVGLGGAPVLGVVFGIGWTPCIGPTLAAVLLLATSSGDAARGAGLSFAYSLGLGVPFILAAGFLQRFLGTSGWARRHARAITRSGGGVLIVLGIVQVTGLWTLLMSSLQGLITGWAPPL